MGKGFDLTAVRGRSKAVLFATGSGISPIRALLRSGTLKTDAGATTLYYGTRDAEATAFLEESASWPCDVVRVYSEDSGKHVQDVLREDIASGKIDANDTFAVLCGQKEMADEVIEMLTSAGLPREACVMNF
jgi:NAD(P)H-flavin reductase